MRKLRTSLFRKYDLSFLPIVASGEWEEVRVFYTRQILDPVDFSLYQNSKNMMKIGKQLAYLALLLMMWFTA